MNRLAGKVSLGILLFITLVAAAAASPVSLLSKAEPSLFADSAGGGLSDTGQQVSADGRYVVFLSGRNAVSGLVDANQGADIFLRDRVAGTTVLVSRSAASGSTTANAESGKPVLSADGRWIVFLSSATDLVPGQVDGNNNDDVFLFDRITGTVRLISHAAGSETTAGDQMSFTPTISADGAYIAFVNYSSNLVAGQTGTGAAYLYDRAAGTTRIVSHAAGSPTAARAVTFWQSPPRLSADGRFVVYGSGWADLVAGSTLPAVAIYLYDRTTDTNVLVSHAAGSATTGGNDSSKNPRISADGRYVAFDSRATDLVAGFVANYPEDVFLWDRETGATALVSHQPGSATTNSTATSVLLALSADGAWVLFCSQGDDLIAGGTSIPGSFWDVFLYERATGAVALVSHAYGSATTPADRHSTRGSISADGRYVVFESEARNLLSGPVEPSAGEFDPDIFLYDRTTGEVTLVNHPAGLAGTYTRPSAFSEISADGGTVLFENPGGDLAAGLRDTNAVVDVYVHDRASDTAELISRRASDMPSLAGDRESGGAVTSPDGRWVAFSSVATNLLPGQVDTNNQADLFLHDRRTGATVLVSRKAGASPGTTSNRGSGGGRISDDGRYVAFWSLNSDLVAGQIDTDDYFDVFLFDRDTGTVTLVSRTSASPTTADHGESMPVAMSADGSRVLFSSRATNVLTGVTDANGTLGDLFLFDRDTGAVTLVSHASGSLTTTANGHTAGASLSADGNWLAFESLATNLVAGQVDTNGKTDLFLYDVAAGTTSLVSHTPGSSTATGDDHSLSPSLSPDGAFLVFSSYSKNLVAGQVDTNGGGDTFLFERTTGTVTLVSHAQGSPTTTGNFGGPLDRSPRISADGAWIAFSSPASDLVVAGQSEEPNSAQTDIFLQERATGMTRLVSHRPHLPTTDGSRPSELYGISGDGRYVLYGSDATDMVWNQVDRSFAMDIFLYDRDVHESLLVNRSLASPTQTGNTTFNSIFAFLSEDGGTVVFSSPAPDLVPGDYNGESDLFVYDNGRVGSFHTVTPCRVLDTRQPQDGPALVSGETSILHLHGACGIPETAKAVAANVTVVQPAGMGYLIFYRGDLPGAPVTSTINFGAGQVRANNTIVRLSANADGTLRVHPVLLGGGAVHVLVDLFGYFE